MATELEDELYDAASELRDIGMHNLADAVTTARARIGLREAPPESGIQLAIDFAGWRADQLDLEAVNAVP